jgi:ubiquinone/menaquinone biosynthesis C-methylase UbiE
VPVKRKYIKSRFVFFLILVALTFQFHHCVNGQTLEDRILEKLDLRVGMVVADVGAGNGEFSIKMARIVGEEGHVYANEISDRRLREIKSRIDRENVGNITIVHSEEEDASLPGRADLIILKYVYHHLSKPENFIKNMVQYLKPEGRLTIIAVDIHSVSRERAEKEDRDACISDPEKTRKEIEKCGFVFDKREDVKSSREVDYILFFQASSDRAPFHTPGLSIPKNF